MKTVLLAVIVVIHNHAGVSTDPALRSIVGVDVAETTGGSLHAAHVLYQKVDNERTSAYALGFVMAQLVAGLVESVGLYPRATIVRADGEDARRLARGDSPFTPEQLGALEAAVAALAAAQR